MKFNEYQISAKVWLYPGKAAWHFVTIPEDLSKEITERFEDLKRGWGSLKVKVTIGETTWKTSIFPDKKSKTYLLPLKTEVRDKERIGEGDHIQFLLEILT